MKLLLIRDALRTICALSGTAPWGGGRTTPDRRSCSSRIDCRASRVCSPVLGALNERLIPSPIEQNRWPRGKLLFGLIPRLRVLVSGIWYKAEDVTHLVQSAIFAESGKPVRPP